MLDVRGLKDALYYGAKDMCASNNADIDDLTDQCEEQLENITGAILAIKKIAFEWQAWGEDITRLGMREEDLLDSSKMMYETLTAYRLLHRSMDALREFIRPMNFDNKMDFYEYNEDFRQLRHLQSAVERALSDPLLWDYFVFWNVSCDGYLRDQEDLIQNRIARHCLDYGGNNLG